MNSIILEVQPPTPPRTKRQSLPLITLKSKSYNYSLQLTRNLNPPELSISGPHSQRLRHEENKNRDKLVGEDGEPPSYSLFSRRQDKYVTRERTESQLFLVRNKNSSCKKKVFLKSLDQQEEIGKPKRDFDEYLTYIKSNSDKYILCKPPKRDSEFTLEIAKTIYHLFFRISESLESNPLASKQLCITYLSLTEKLEFQSSIHLGINQSALNKLFIIQRLISYYVIILYGSNKFNIYVPLFIKSSYYFSGFYQSLIDIIRKRQPKLGIGSTVRSTQLLCEIEKGCKEILGDMKLLTKPLSRELYEADKQLILLLNYANEKDFEERVMKLEHTLNWKLFKLPPIPYLPATDYQYTLLLELDTTITYYDQTNKLLMFRPHLQQFLDAITTRYQVILYTIAIKQYADKIVEQIDPFNRIFKGRLYNEHISMNKGEYHKDLGKIGRDLGRVVVVDSEGKSYGGYEGNRLEITKWYGSQFDDSLKGITDVLKTLVDNGEKDVRKRIKHNTTNRMLTHISQQPEQTLVSNK